MVKAVMLVRVKPQVRVADEIKKIEGVRDAFNVTGRFDAVALIEVRDLADVKRVALKVHEIEGVKRTETLIHIE